MPVKFAHDCGTRVTIPDRVAGRRVRCPRCRRAFIAPSTAEAIPFATLAAEADIPVARLVPDPPPPPPSRATWVALAGLALLAASGLALVQANGGGEPRIPVISCTLMVGCVALAVHFRSRRDRAIARRGAGDDERTDAADAEAATEAKRALAAGWFALTYLFKVLISLALLASNTYIPLIAAMVLGFVVTFVGGIAARDSRPAPFPREGGVPDARLAAAAADRAAVARFALGVIKLIVIGLLLCLALILLMLCGHSRMSC